MHRLALLSLVALTFLAAIAGGLFALPLTEAGRDLQATAPPTNTPRPTVPPTNTPRPSPTPPPATPTPIVVGPEEYPENINSLTGLPYPNEEARNRRNLIVKV